MKVAVLSGKGGTGKTLVSVNLAASASEALYIDCDVEEPNGHLFFKPQGVRSVKVPIKIPVVDQKLCIGCRSCVEFCKFNALAYIHDKLVVFEQICHSCGGCTLFCPEKALAEKDMVIGEVKKGTSQNVTVVTGILNTGEASGVPIIRQLLQEASVQELPVFIDCPPGSACVVMESIKDADYCILVAEPTIFGAHNFDYVYQLVQLFKKPHGAILNKCLAGDNPAEKACLDKGIPILGRIPFDNTLGMLNSNARIAARENRKYQEMFASLLDEVIKEVQHETATNP